MPKLFLYLIVSASLMRGAYNYLSANVLGGKLFPLAISMFRLSNFRMVLKVGLIAVLTGTVLIGLLGYMAMSMSAVDRAYLDLSERVDASTILVAQTTRLAESYRASAYALLTETSDAGNARLLRSTEESSTQVVQALAMVRGHLPEKATEVARQSESFDKAFAACRPAILFASTITTPEQNLKAAQRMRAECEDVLSSAVASQLRFADELVAYAKARADEQHAATLSGIRIILACSVICALGSIGVAFAIGIFGIARPIQAIVQLLQQLAAGDYDVDIRGADRNDEIGDVAKAALVFKENGLAKIRVEADQRELERRSVAQRKSDMLQLASGFEAAAGEIVETVSSASSELEASATTLALTTGRAKDITTMVAAASEAASANVQSVASRTEELSSSVNEISRQVQVSAQLAKVAVGQALSTTEIVSELTKAAGRIEDVVELINTIAGQTNLLALNATIESARAGEAGRGFAVVATEVKALSEQTAKATGEIAEQISSIQAAIRGSVVAIRDISGTITRLSEISSTVAAALEEQGAATQEISRNVQQAAHGTHQVTSNIARVQQGAIESGAASSRVLSAAVSLASDSKRLKHEVGKFLQTVRSA